MQNRFWHSAFEVDLQTVQPFGHSFDGNWPKYFINNLSPHSGAVQEESYCTCSQNFVLVIYNTVLVMHSHAAEC